MNNHLYRGLLTLSWLIISISCTKESEFVTTTNTQKESITLEIINFVSDKNNVSSKFSNVWYNRSITTNESEFNLCSDTEIIILGDTFLQENYQITPVGFLTENGSRIGIKLIISTGTSNLNLTLSDGVIERNFELIPNKSFSLFFASIENSITATIDIPDLGDSTELLTIPTNNDVEVCDFGDATCLFPKMPDLKIPENYTLELIDIVTKTPDYEFQGLTEGTVTIDSIVLDEYDVDLQSEPIVEEEISNQMSLAFNERIDFKTEKDKTKIKANPNQTLVLIAKNNINPSSVYISTATSEPTQAADFDNYVGAYLKLRGGGFTVQIQDLQGNTYTESIEATNDGIAYRILICPTAEVGIQIQEGLFEDVIDTIL